MKKILTALFFSAICLGSYAQKYDAKMDDTQNRLTVGGGVAYTFNDISEFGAIYRGSSSLELSVDYAHLWNISRQHALGFELNGYQSHLDANGCNIYYGGVGIVYNFRTNNGWIFSLSDGVGYAGNDFDVHWDEGGIGGYSKLGAHYKLTKHLAVGAEARLLSAFFGEETLIGEHVIHVVQQLGVSTQLRWCF